MFRHGKFKSNRSFKRPYFVAPCRTLSGKLHSAISSKTLKSVTNRKLRRMPIESIDSGCAYKRLVEVWDHNGDQEMLHQYLPLAPEDDEVNHTIIKGGHRYFPK